MIDMKYIKWVNKNIKSLENKTIVITGATGSIGIYTTKYLAYLKANIIIAVRNAKKGNALIEDIKKDFPDCNISMMLVDFSSVESVDNFSNELTNINMDYYITTAGVYHLPETVTKDGLEIHYETNYYNQIRVIERLNKDLPIIVVSSISHKKCRIDFDNLMSLGVKNRTKVYGRSKRLLNYHLVNLKNKGYDIRITHPGISATSLFASEKGGFGKLFNLFIVPIMKLIFHSPDKASLPVLLGLNEEVEVCKEIGPKGLFNAWGYPKVVKLSKKLLDEQKQTKIIEYYNSLKK